MRLRFLLLGLLLGTLLLSLPGVAVSSANSYRASSASLRALWTQDVAAGLNPELLAPLQAELSTADDSTFVSLPTLTFNPSASQSLLASLRERTNAIYAASVVSSRDQAQAAKLQFTTAFGPLSTPQSHALREEFDAAQTPSDFSTLAASLHLDALLVPLDRNLSARQVTLAGLRAQAHALSLTTTLALANETDLTAYFLSDPTTRYALATTLLTRTDASIASLRASIKAELAKRAAIAKAKAAAAAAARARAATTYTASSYGMYLYLTGNYNDCTAVTLLKGGLYRDTCIHTTYYLVSHKWSIGASFSSLHVGSILYFGGQRYTISSRTIISPWAEAEHLYQENFATNVAPLTLQTCWTDSGSLFLILEARRS